MKVISFIEQPSVIRRILKHLDLWKDPRHPPQPLELVCEPSSDYVPWQDDVQGSPGNHKHLVMLDSGDRGWICFQRSGFRGECALMRRFQ